MTTKVTIDPAGHEIEISISEGPADDNVVSKETLAIGSVPREFWLYGTRVITVREKAQ